MNRFLVLLLMLTALSGRAAQTDDPVGSAVETYFTAVFAKLGEVAAQQPVHDTFRDAMKPAAESVNGFFGGSLITTDFVIDQSYYKRHALAVGFDLKKVKELDYFRNLMRTSPSPQLSEPGHGTILQPRLISMRYPVVVDGKLQSIVSMMVRTETFLEATGLGKCRAYKIICRGALAEEKGILSADHREVKLVLPSTEWVIQYDP
ncbi:MAG TPA: hypothetical protein PLD51_08590 [Pontiellaceae bacterium]|nr:hypothetical protein [Pontiellaceae bacterium]HPR83900.1 hypothetical protein [Pontiellaceae bacterium]